MQQNKKLTWAGRIISALVCLPFLMSAGMKFSGKQEVIDGMAHLGLSETILRPLAMVEILCVLLYAIPYTSVLGAVLLAGYMGGTIIAHWRVGDPFLTQVVIGLVIWLGIYLREPRLRAILPIRK